MRHQTATITSFFYRLYVIKETAVSFEALPVPLPICHSTNINVIRKLKNVLE